MSLNVLLSWPPLVVTLCMVSICCCWLFVLPAHLHTHTSDMFRKIYSFCLFVLYDISIGFWWSLFLWTRSSKFFSILSLIYIHIHEGVNLKNASALVHKSLFYRILPHFKITNLGRIRISRNRVPVESEPIGIESRSNPSLSEPRFGRIRIRIGLRPNPRTWFGFGTYLLIITSRESGYPCFSSEILNFPTP
jgi:hypothetical protein